ncbi:MAG TPA: hypothetical protein VJJ26_03245 [Candidatus Babeliales bacterium]|nr:hypothetical protein [Candidatus Babeliales bacterium]
MKTVNKVMLFVFACLTLSNLPIHCFYNDGYPSGALSGAAIGGLAGGRKGAAIGLGVGAGMDIMGAAARSDRRRYDDDYYDRDYRSSRRSRKQRMRDLENENAQLRQQLQYQE